MEIPRSLVGLLRTTLGLEEQPQIPCMPYQHELGCSSRLGARRTMLSRYRTQIYDSTVALPGHGRSIANTTIWKPAFPACSPWICQTTRLGSGKAQWLLP